MRDISRRPFKHYDMNAGPALKNKLKSLCARGEFTRRLKALAEHKADLNPVLADRLLRKWAPRVTSMDCDMDRFYGPYIYFLNAKGSVIGSVSWEFSGKDHTLWRVYCDDEELESTLGALLDSWRDAADLIL